jgi:ribonuclease HII
MNAALELELLNAGYDCVVGIDEAGRGAWAGPVSVGYYTYRLGCQHLEGVDDSKQVPAKRRALLFSELSNHDQCGCLLADNDIVDSKGIAVAIEDLIAEIIQITTTFNQIPPQKAFILIDGRFKRKFGEHTRQVIGGDAAHYSIAAASILAKVSRDNLMYDLDLLYPDYKFRSHVGYGTRQHIAAIREFGLSKIHRKSYDIDKYATGFNYKLPD